ncbi:hypothetical protein CBR_g23615 [Chara braunii]|uniref:CCHC-type domain-containing protein n=1 Tax=Chara braunii TaxID=69332 RepID=A0A388L4Q5_CHABU|nr:hypothetical protein CBR_g23615 [Chara braunii]|eukprot:GBG77286.1 hypothetical protein CBR_g23615 [Chara braunii]
MAAPVPRGAFFNCGQHGHWSRECPHRAVNKRHTVDTGANAEPILALPAAGAATTASASASTTTYQAPRTGWWSRNQQILDKCNDFVSRAQQKERDQLEAEEQGKRRLEEEEQAARVKKEREEFEERVGQRLEGRLASMCETLMGKRADNARTSTDNDEVSRLRRENEDLHAKYGIKEALPSTGLVDSLQRENAELKRQEALLKQQMEGDLAALRWEIKDLKENREIMGKGELTKQIEDLRSEMEALRKRNEAAEVSAGQWRSEALRPGNKRGSINISTPVSEGRAGARSKTTTATDVTKRLREEIEDLQELRRCDKTEVDMLKERRALAEARRADAEAEIARLREKMKLLSTEEVGCGTPKEHGTNLKDKMEEAAKTGFKTGRKGRVKMTPGRLPRPDGVSKSVNDKFVFLQDERKRMKALKKTGLELLCQEEGIKYKTIEVTVEELAQLYAEGAFGGSSETGERINSGQRPGKAISADSDVAVVEEVPSDSA